MKFPDANRANALSNELNPKIGGPLIQNLRVMRDEENLPLPFVDRVGHRHQPRLNFAKRYEVLRLIKEDGETPPNDKVQNGIEAN